MGGFPLSSEQVKAISDDFPDHPKGDIAFGFTIINRRLQLQPRLGRRRRPRQPLPRPPLLHGPHHRRRPLPHDRRRLPRLRQAQRHRRNPLVQRLLGHPRRRAAASPRLPAQPRRGRRPGPRAARRLRLRHLARAHPDRPPTSGKAPTPASSRPRSACTARRSASTSSSTSSPIR